MIDTNVLRGRIAERRLSQAKVAETLGISPKAFYEKMKRGVFNSNEIDKMIKLLEIEDAMAIFFADDVTL